MKVTVQFPYSHTVDVDPDVIADRLNLDASTDDIREAIRDDIHDQILAHPPMWDADSASDIIDAVCDVLAERGRDDA